MLFKSIDKKIRIASNTLPKILNKNFKPKNFKFNLHDLGRMYHLQGWILRNSPTNRMVDQEIKHEILTNEMNYHHFISQLKRFFGVMGLLMVVYVVYDDP